MPLQACIHKVNNKANRPRPDASLKFKKKEEKKQEVAKGTSEDISNTPEGQSAKGTPQALTISSSLGKTPPKPESTRSDLDTPVEVDANGMPVGQRGYKHAHT